MTDMYHLLEMSYNYAVAHVNMNEHNLENDTIKSDLLLKVDKLLFYTKYSESIMIRA